MSTQPVIMIVDDDEATQEVLAFLLEDAGYAPVSILSGEHVFGAIKKMAPALILLDLFMPDENGLDLLRRLKQDEDLKSIPVIIHTLMDDDAYRRQALELGAEEYLLKPLDLSDVLDVVAKRAPIRPQ